MRNILDRIKYLKNEIAAGMRHDGWVLSGLKVELKRLLEIMKQNKKN